MNLTSYSIDFNANNHEDAKSYMDYRSLQFLKFGVRLNHTEKIQEGWIYFYTCPHIQGGPWASIYLLENFRGKQNYTRLLQQWQVAILTLKECEIEDYLISRKVYHAVFEHSPAYKLISSYYGDKKAKRSGIPYIYHIDEGLAIQRMMGFDNQLISDAFCLHPMLQSDEDYEKNKNFDFYSHGIDERAVDLAIQYRDTANSYLSNNQLEDFVGFPNQEVAYMLLMDKVQNFKDLILFNQSHPRYDSLCVYFENWFKLLHRYFDHKFQLELVLSNIMYKTNFNRMNNSDCYNRFKIENETN